jgi:EmrB/QacA subfamily drug resistance transporter
LVVGHVAHVTAAPSPATSLPHGKLLIVFSALMLGQVLASLDQTIVATALPTIVGDLHGLDKYYWVVTAYLIGFTSSAPLWGKVSDLYGRKPVFQAVVCVFLAGSALAGLSQTMNELILFRGVQGIGASGLIVLGAAIIGDVAPPIDRGRYQGLFGAAIAVSSVTGPLVGGIIVEHTSWRWIFYINLPLGAAALLVIALAMPSIGRRVRHSIDYVGGVLLVAGVSSVLLAMSILGVHPGSVRPPDVVLLGSGIAILCCFAWWEGRHATEPIVPLRLFRIRVFTLANTGSFVVGALSQATAVYLPFYLQFARGISPIDSGLSMLPVMAGVLITSVGSGWIISKTGRYKIFPMIGMPTVAAGLLILSHVSIHTAPTVIGLGMLLAGLGIGCSFQVLVLVAQNGVPHPDLGAATSLATCSRTMGGAFGITLYGTLLVGGLIPRLAAELPPGTPPSAVARLSQSLSASPRSIAALPARLHAPITATFVGAVDELFAVAALIALAGFVVACFLPEIRLRHAADDEADMPVGSAVPDTT